MYSWRVTKYNPAFRDSKGAYQKDEWISFGDVGETVGGDEVTLDMYLQAEDAYVDAVISSMNTLGISKVIVTSLERHHHEISGNSLLYPPKMFDVYSSLRNGIELSIADVDFICRLVLREHLWCKLEVNGLFFVHFGYDYYMYIGSYLDIHVTLKTVAPEVLFIEEYLSPYLE